MGGNGERGVLPLPSAGGASVPAGRPSAVARVCEKTGRKISAARREGAGIGSGKLPLSPVPREHPFRQGVPSAVCPCLRKRWKKFRQPEGNGWEWKTRSPLPLLGTGETLVPARGPLRCAPSLARKVEKMPAARRERAGMGSGAVSYTHLRALCGRGD